MGDFPYRMPLTSTPFLLLSRKYPVFPGTVRSKNVLSPASELHGLASMTEDDVMKPAQIVGTANYLIRNEQTTFLLVSDLPIIFQQTVYPVGF